MKKLTPVITDEHIVAYLDGELEAGQDFRKEIRANPDLTRAAREYAAMKKIFASSRTDSRFNLSARLDNETRTILANELATSRQTVRTAASAPIAAPVRSTPAVRSIKYLFAKRVGIGFAVVALAVSLWFNFTTPKPAEITQVPVHAPANTSVPQKETVQPPAIEVLPPAIHYAAKEISRSVNTAKRPVAPPQNIAANTISQSEAPRTELKKEDPADIMISRRYAKMIKATPEVEITQQDRVSEQM